MSEDRIEQATAAPGEKRHIERWCPHGVFIDGRLHVCTLYKHVDDVEHELRPLDVIQ